MIYLYGKRTTDANWELLLNTDYEHEIKREEELCKDTYVLFKRTDALIEKETDKDRFLILAKNYEHEIWTRADGQIKLEINFPLGTITYRFDTDGRLMDSSNLSRY